MRSAFTASRFEFFMLLEYRSLNPDLEMIQTYSGEVFHLNEACIYVPREMMKSWLEFSRTIRKLELTNKELAVTLAVALTFRGIYEFYCFSFIMTQITHSLHNFVLLLSKSFLNKSEQIIPIFENSWKGMIYNV